MEDKRELNQVNQIFDIKVENLEDENYGGYDPLENSMENNCEHNQVNHNAEQNEKNSDPLNIGNIKTACLPAQNLYRVQKNLPPIQLPTQPVPKQDLTSDSFGANTFIAIDPNTGIEYKVELTNGQLKTLNIPLPATLNESIFNTETSGLGTRFYTENDSEIYTTKSTASIPTLLKPQMQQSQQQPQQEGGKNNVMKRQHNGNMVLVDSIDNLPCGPDDEDLNTPYECDTCNRTFLGHVMLKVHQYQEHYENPHLSQIEIGDKYVCRVCLKLFTRNSDVKAHILRIHCGDRRYPCTICGKRFKESTHLRKHLFSHTGKFILSKI